MHKILHLTFAHNPFDVRVFEKEAVSLAQDNFSVTLGVPLTDNPEMADGDIIDNVTFRHLPRAKGIRGYWKRLQLAAELIADVNPHLIHIHDPELILLYFMIGGRKIVYDAHEDAPKEALLINAKKPIKARLMALYWRLLLWLVYKKFSGVVAAVASIQAQFPQSKTILVRNYPMFSRIAPAGASLNQRANHFAYIGTISRERGLFEMLDAVEHLHEQQAKLVLIGKFVNSAEEQTARAHRAWDRVKYLGWQRWDEALAELDHCRAGFLVLEPDPSFAEALPVKLFEYIGKGLPIIHTNIEAWNRLTGEAGIQVSFGETDQLVNAMRSIMNNTQLAAMAEKTLERRTYFVENLSWENEFKNLRSLYRNILKSQPE